MAATPGPACCTELGHSVCLQYSSSPRSLQPFCASPRLCPSQPPEVLALVRPLVSGPGIAPAFPLPIPAPVCTVLCCECELSSHLLGSSDETPARTWGTCTVHKGWSL